MDRGEAFSLPGVRVHLRESQGVGLIPADATFWERMKADGSLRAGRILGVHSVRTDEDVHASKWERHPNGDELVCVVSGRVDVVLDEPSGERRIPLEPFTGTIVPQGVWHRLQVKEPSVLVGVIFGTLPANRAARLNPVDTLKYE